MRRAGVAVVALALCLLLVVVGRWERNRAALAQNTAMRKVLDDAGPSLTARPISGYRREPYACLAYEQKPVTYALQVCFDSDGRLVETVDRRSGVPKYASLSWQPSLATIRYSPARIAALVAQASRPPRSH